MTHHIIYPDDIRISIYRSFEEAEFTWKRFETEAECFVFQSYAWLSNWYDIIGAKVRTQVFVTLVEYPHDNPIMLLPLGIQQKGVVSCLMWLGGEIADYHGPLLAKNCSQSLNREVFETAWERIQKQLPPIDVIYFDKQPEYIQEQQNPLVWLGGRPHPSNAHFTLLEGDLESFYKNKRGAKWRSQLGRKQRRLQDHGTVGFVVPKSPDEIDFVVETMMSQKSKSYRKIGANNIFRDLSTREFFKKISKCDSSKSIVHVSALKLNSEILATHWGWFFKDRYYYYMPTYTESNFNRFSPGAILLKHLFSWNFERGTRVFDFTTGDEPYKQHWCDRELKLFDYVYPITLRGCLYAYAVRQFLNLKRNIKRSPVRWAVVSFLRAKIAAIRFWVVREKDC